MASKTKTILKLTIPTLLIMLALAATSNTLGVFALQAPAPALTLTTYTDKPTYLLRQRVLITGSMTLNGQPATNLLVNVQIDGPNGPRVHRTLVIGTPTMTWPVNITDLYLKNSTGELVNTVKINSMMQAGVTIHNWQLTPWTVYATITVFDANMAEIGDYYASATIDPLNSASFSFQFQVPTWACAGRALIVGNVYDGEPRAGGLALSPEKDAYYYLSRTQGGMLGYPVVPLPGPQNTPGTYRTNITLPPDPTAGTYHVYAMGQASLTTTYLQSTTFAAQSSSGYPPQASFIFWPAAPYVNMSVLFDASSSSPEGYNDYITTYKWTFGDGTPPVTQTVPTIFHNYMTANTFIATLNVTDHEGLWSTTSKPIKIYPEFGPTANFTYTPSVPIKGSNVTFDGSSSTTGWYAKKAYFSPIATYAWNFSDGTGLFTITTPTISHLFVNPGNYSVKLKVTDADGRFNTKSYIVQVLNITIKMYDVNGDHIINLKDVFATAKAFGSRPGSPNWNPACDFDKNGVVNLVDYFGVCLHFGKDP